MKKVIYDSQIKAALSSLLFMVRPSSLGGLPYLLRDSAFIPYYVGEMLAEDVDILREGILQRLLYGLITYAPDVSSSAFRDLPFEGHGYGQISCPLSLPRLTPRDCDAILAAGCNIVHFIPCIGFLWNTQAWQYGKLHRPVTSLGLRRLCEFPDDAVLKTIGGHYE